MTKIVVYRLPKSNDDEVLKLHMKPMRLARLRSLKTDPTHFYSKHDEEEKQDQEFWLARIRPSHVQHYVVLSANEDHVDSVDVLVDDNTVFHGFMVVINEYEEEINHAAEAGRPVDQIIVNDIPTYFLGALYVDRSLRSQGIGSRIIQTSINWIREDARSKGWPKVRYRVTAMKGNDRAVNLYLRNGFMIDHVEKQGATADNIYTELSMTVESSDRM